MQYITEPHAKRGTTPLSVAVALSMHWVQANWPSQEATTGPGIVAAPVDIRKMTPVGIQGSNFQQSICIGTKFGPQ